jgi:hypothetical protein
VLFYLANAEWGQSASSARAPGGRSTVCYSPFSNRAQLNANMTTVTPFSLQKMAAFANRRHGLR